ncbi:MAG: NAD(P)H-hydrate dehydratase [Butyricicoccaceae bacterium]
MKELDWELSTRSCARRAAESSKNDYGRILCVCGSAGYTGAAFFAAQGAVRMGSGVVTLAVPERAWPVLAVKLSEPVVRPLPCTEDGLFSVRALPRLLELAGACGRAAHRLRTWPLGRGDRGRVHAAVRKAACPIVLDADGIFALAQHKDILHRTAKPLVMTPHAGEFARLSGKKQMQPEELRAFAQENRCTVLYKAHRTLIAAPDGRLFRNHTGNPGMAKGGSGDTLAGMLVSLIGQGLAPEDAACAAAWLHGAAGDSAANRYGEYGMTPTDLLACLPGVTRRYNTREW